MLNEEKYGAPMISAKARKVYLIRRTEEFAQCRAALDSGDWAFVARVGHKLKGNAETFGLANLSDLGANLEQQGDAQDRTEAVKTLSQLERLVAEALFAAKDSGSDEA